jgi:hypothetical protein
VTGWGKIGQPSGPWKQAGVAILTSDKVDFKPKLFRRDKEGHFTLIKGVIYQEEITNDMILYLKDPKTTPKNS